MVVGVAMRCEVPRMHRAPPTSAHEWRPFTAAIANKRLRRPVRGARASYGGGLNGKKKLFITKNTDHMNNESVIVSYGLAAEADLGHLMATVELSVADRIARRPHIASACRIVGPCEMIVSEAAWDGQASTAPAALSALESAGEQARGGTAYFSLEPQDEQESKTIIHALQTSGIQRAVIAMRASGRSKGFIAGPRRINLPVEVLGEATAVDEPWAERVQHAAFAANEDFLHRSVLQLPLGLFKYAMTLDGKIAATGGHSNWVSGEASRGQVMRERAACDAVIVGGATVRRDNPRLTARVPELSVHQPTRIVLSQTLDLPKEANLWDVSAAPTVVATASGVRPDLQAHLRDKGVEVVEFEPPLHPLAVARMCFERGYMRCFWECGGTLAAPAIAAGVIHKVLAFIAPKLIGGIHAPTPIGELGLGRMTDALCLVEGPSWKPFGPDMSCTGYLPASGGVHALYNRMLNDV